MSLNLTSLEKMVLFEFLSDVTDGKETTLTEKEEQILNDIVCTLEIDDDVPVLAGESYAKFYHESLDEHFKNWEF